MRQFWLKDKKTLNNWNFTPENPRQEYGGCVFANVKGLGFENDIEQTQVEIDYFINKVVSKNKTITGTLYFVSPIHAASFQEFIGDFSKQFELHYSPDGSVIAEDQLSRTWYKNVVISKLDKAERNRAGWYECAFELKTQSDIWRRDIEINSNQGEQFGSPLVYPYFYPFVYGGQNTIAVDITNIGRDTGCEISIKNTNETGNIVNPSWILEHSYLDQLSQKVDELQYAKFNIQLQPGRTLIVDSGTLTQRAIVKNDEGTIYENVRNSEEINFDYIDYIVLKNGANKIYFNIGVGNTADISLKYCEMRELI